MFISFLYNNCNLTFQLKQFISIFIAFLLSLGGAKQLVISENERERWELLSTSGTGSMKHQARMNGVCLYGVSEENYDISLILLLTFQY